MKDNMIPNGEVDNSVTFDFSEGPRPIGKEIGPLLDSFTRGYDHFFIKDR